MTMRETAIAKLQQLPEPLLQQVSDFIDLLLYERQHNTAIRNPQGELVEVWVRWFESVDRLEVIPTKSVNEYQQLLLSKYRQQGLEL